MFYVEVSFADAVCVVWYCREHVQVPRVGGLLQRRQQAGTELGPLHAAAAAGGEAAASAQQPRHRGRGAAQTQPTLRALAGMAHLPKQISPISSV